MAIRNFYVELDVDGRSTRIGVGPQAKDGGFDLTVKQRSDGEVLPKSEDVDITGRSDGKTLTLRIWHGGKLIFERVTERG